MKKLNGYRPTHRNRWKFITAGILTIQELSLLEFYADIMDFDVRHDKYGKFEVYFDEIGQIFKVSVNTVRNWHNKLVFVGFIQKTSRPHIFKMVCHERYISPGIWKGRAVEYEKQEKDQPIEIILHSFEINLQTLKEKLQNIGNKNKIKPATKVSINSIAIGSSKVEYKDFKILSDEDMKWIDENVTEDDRLIQRN